jgi:hypothetical protein
MLIKNIIKSYSSFRNSINIRNKTNIFIIIDKFLKENLTNILQKLSLNEFRLVKYLSFNILYIRNGMYSVREWDISFHD